MSNRPALDAVRLDAARAALALRLVELGVDAEVARSISRNPSVAARFSVGADGLPVLHLGDVPTDSNEAAYFDSIREAAKARLAATPTSQDFRERVVGRFG